MEVDRARSAATFDHELASEEVILVRARRAAIDPPRPAHVGLFSACLDDIPIKTYHEQTDSPRRSADFERPRRPKRTGAAGAGRTCPRPRRRRWSAGRRRTPTSLGCARPRKARGGPSQGSPGCGSQRTRRLPALHFPCVQGRRKKGKGRRPAPENRSPRAAERCLPAFPWT